MAHVDRVHAQDDCEHPETRDQVCSLSEVVERIADAPALYQYGRLLDDILAVLNHRGRRLGDSGTVMAAATLL
ncbi:MAG TPA: hypothetical protein VMW34_18210, partial [Anaerolineales bacterium]|nr:hypothetical protein [Anaerolineales bacterium]